MLLRTGDFRNDPPGTTRTFNVGGIIYVYSQSQHTSVFRFVRFEDNLMIISRTTNGNPGLDYSITLAMGWKFTLEARIFEIQSWDKAKGTVTLTAIQ